MDLFFRAVVVFAFIYFLTRVVGRRELASLEPFDLILLIVIGDAVQQGLTQDDYSLTGAIIVVSVIGLLQIETSYLSFRFKRLRPVLEGAPIVLVERGRVIERNLRRERMTHGELAAELRQQQVASVDDVEWAALETNGTVTVIPKSS